MGAEVPKFDTFEAFWPYYLQEHRDPLNRRLHFIGTTLVIVSVVLAVVTLNPCMLGFAPLTGYGFAWIGHFFVEKNRPATFTYPLWSLRGDFKMYGMTWTGALPAELAKAVGSA
jgi:hypothetical protein